MEAKDKAWEGVVEVELPLLSDGQISGLGIAKFSSYPLLDKAAMSAINKKPVPTPPFLRKYSQILLKIRQANPYNRIWNQLGYLFETAKHTKDYA